jgi:hypothetical protein
MKPSSESDMGEGVLSSGSDRQVDVGRRRDRDVRDAMVRPAWSGTSLWSRKESSGRGGGTRGVSRQPGAGLERPRHRRYRRAGSGANASSTA